ncbi:chemotaxis protein [Bradyrhizobium sp. BRP22]|uniref:chemotaxis protein n=1 Tax=Bradyrhizobium sp. BRP22 TaxID=2793821 RepID=UPI001CD5930F|nr:chemotaxis protein [Bradyrhizobium sp. BRP22]MCA1451756.1 chemotaxis protein [Bradyrhizobium sp. BRP22]
MIPLDDQTDTVAAAVATIEDVSSRIEDSFARVGNHLGRGHALFKELEGALTELSREMSGAEIEGTSAALQDIAGRLTALAEALPAESALLGRIGEDAEAASAQIAPLFKHIQMISIIARSARIEAASLDGDRDSFLDFTKEAFELGQSVQHSIESCARDQKLLSVAVETALNRQKEFEKLYREQLLSASAGLISAYTGMREQQDKSVHLVELAGSSTRKIADAVGSAIISLQSGDSTRQRLEHVCSGLRRVAGRAASIVPGHEADAGAQRAQIIRQLQAAQLKDAEREFGDDIGAIVRSLNAILGDATGVVAQGRSVYGGRDGEAQSFLAVIKQTLAQASELIATCESSGKSVDAALSVVEDTLGKFRLAIAGLGEAVVDIILIGMNASLKAGHLGVKGNAFVVIANELKVTADQVSAGASRLKPILDRIERAAADLKELRDHGNPAQLTRLEPSILQTLQESEAGNARLGRLMDRLVREGAEFEALMGGARDLMTALGEASTSLPAAAARLEASSAIAVKLSLTSSDQAVLDDLFAQYTMERERQVHRDVMQRLGLMSKSAPHRPEAEVLDDGVLLF